MARPSRHTPEMLKEYRPIWGNMTYADYWDRNAELYPDREAIVDSRTRLTWAQAKVWIDRLALGLRDMGFKRDDVLVIQLPNWVESYMLRVACEKAGILSLIALRNWRHAEMEHTFNKSGAVGVVAPVEFEGRDYYQVVQDLKPKFPNLKHVMVVGDRAPAGAISIREMLETPIEKKYPKDFLAKEKHKADEVMLFLTSGSTGFPKFVEQPIGARINYMRMVGESWGLHKDDVFASLSPVGTGPSAMVYLMAPITGTKIAMLESFDAEEALKLIQRERVTVIGTVPAITIMMVQHPNFSKYDLSSLRLIFAGAAPWTYSMAMDVQKKFGCNVLHGFGAVDMGLGPVHTPDETVEERLLTTGKVQPVGGIRGLKVVDSQGKELPWGEVGDLVGGGPLSSSGYFKDPEATKAAWSADGWYHTGDMAKFDEKGNLVIVGRVKDMVLRGGQNVYPIEIETMLVTHPKVKDCAIVAMPDPVLGEKACAVIVPKPGETVTFEDIVSFLRAKHIASYKLPERLEIKDKLPLLPDVAKVNKKLLREEITAKLRAEGVIGERDR
ncbi:MAG: AMP-binding protein [Chloroflexi bacterium]|nr:AMP-binding protein [Chloroflexota bacterium]